VRPRVNATVQREPIFLRTEEGGTNARFPPDRQIVDAALDDRCGGRFFPLIKSVFE